MNHTEQRQRFRTMLAGSKCLSPASVYDPLSARVAQAAGYELGMLAGSVSSNTTLGAPDIIVLTLTEFADQIRRIMRASTLSLLVDADHGYGNALNVMRTIEEVEHAGASALSIEDTALPARFRQSGAELISTEEMVGKLRAGVRARGDKSLVIAGRTSALKVEGTEATVARVKAYTDTGIDAIFLVGLETLEQLDAVRKVTSLPFIIGSAPASLKREELAARGARVLLQGHQPVAAAAKALYETYAHLFAGKPASELKPRIATSEEMGRYMRGDDYKSWKNDFLK